MVCNKMDYARAKLAGHDIFGTWVTCQMHEYVNIRGTYCSNCTALAIGFSRLCS